MLLRNRLIAAIAAASLLTGFGLSARADEPADYAKLLEKESPAVVSIKLVMKIKAGGQDHEQEGEISGLMIDPKGLILCANDDLNPMAAMRGRLGARAANISVTPTDLKVLIGDDNEGVEAKVVSTDTELDLAWVQIKEPKGPYAYVDFTKGSDAKIGQSIMAVYRMGKYFDRVAAVSEGRVGGLTSKPRKLLVPTGGIITGSGFAIFGRDGTPVGFAVLQIPEEDEEGGGGSRSGPQPMILPSADVAKATQRAKDAPQKPKDEESDSKTSKKSDAKDKSHAKKNAGDDDEKPVKKGKKDSDD